MSDLSFEAWPKIGRLRRTCTITEKLDGTNAQIQFDYDKGEMERMKNTRRSGRTTQGLRQALSLVHDNSAHVQFVVWNHHMVGTVRAMLHDLVWSEYRESSWKLNRVSVIGYSSVGAPWAPWATPRFVDAQVYDHYVTERLEERRTGVRAEECIRVCLVVNEWTREAVVPMNVLGGASWKMAVHEPISWMVAYGEELASDTVAMKTVTFVWNRKYSKDGLPTLVAQ